ncbi:MAG: tRNA modification GTPase [Myxococcota bacterium]
MDTVVAAATPAGRGAIAVLRLSGAEALPLAQRLCPDGPPWRPRRLSLRRALGRDGETLDELLVAWMPGPNSFTGEDIVELSCHGNPVIVEALLSALVEAGARLARPGEFTRRALENGRTTLLAAEALDGLIRAASPAGVALARTGMDGHSDALAATLRESLLDAAAELEARLDHPDDELGYEEDVAVCGRLQAVATRAEQAAETWRAGRIRLHGAVVALVGPTNAGKSSLFNHLVGQRRALVSPRPGTTRDVVERSVLLGGLEVRFLDTAGERLAPEDPIEAEGIALGQELTRAADLLLVTIPLHEPLSEAAAGSLARTVGRRRLVVGTHLDRAVGVPAVSVKVDVVVSSETGEGIEVLRSRVRSELETGPAAEQVAVLSQRQHDLFRAVAAHATQAAEALSGMLGPAVAAEEATAALERLAELSGEDVRESVLDRLFSRFCVGK